MLLCYSQCNPKLHGSVVQNGYIERMRVFAAVELMHCQEVAYFVFGVYVKYVPFSML